MTNIMFSTLPAEIHVIAKHCERNDLINLCLTSKQVNENCLHVLYRHVDLLYDPYGIGSWIDQEYTVHENAHWKRQQQLVDTLLSHPDNGKHVRFLKGTLVVSRFDGYHLPSGGMVSMEDWRHVMQSLTQVQVCMYSSKMSIPNAW